MDEVWRSVDGYESLYQVSNRGNVRSITRYKKVLKPYIDKDGYRTVQLYRKGVPKHFRVARLVATAFVNNPENKPAVNHIDMNRSNDNISNLEWCTNRENVEHAVKNNKYVGSGHISVSQYKDGCVVRTWDSISIAAESLGISAGNICKCLNGVRKHAGGYLWKREEITITERK